MKSKVLKKFYVVFTLVMTFFQNVLGVYAASLVPTPLTVVYEHSYTTLGTSGSSIKVRKVKYTDQSGSTKYGFAYCLEGGAGDVSINDKYTPDLNSDYASSSTGEILDAGIRYITTNGFWGNGSVSSGTTTSSENIEYATTQLAIWLYYYDVSRDSKYEMNVVSRRISSLAREVRAKNYNSGNATYVQIVNGANALCEGAKKARLAQIACQKDSSSCSSTGQESLNASVSSSTMKLNGLYIESELITVSLSGVYNANISVSDSRFTVVNGNGSVVSSVKNGDKVKIRALNSSITDSVNVTVTLSASGSSKVPFQFYGGTYSYNGSTLAKQRLLFTAGYGSTSLRQTLSFKYDLTKKDVIISKTDVTTGKELPGATLEVRDSNGSLVERWVSTSTPHYIKLNPGKYTLKETIAPAGYELSTKVISFEVKANGTTTKVVMENTPIKEEKVYVQFSKTDVTTGKELPGATLEVRDSNGSLVERWVSTSTPHYIKLEPGKYTLKETIAPAGYELSTKVISFEVKANGTTTKVVMENTPIKEEKVYVQFSKTDVTTGKELPGATLEVRDSNGSLVERWVSSTTPHYIKLEPGKYTLKETIAPTGYELSTKVISFEVKANGTTTKVVMENTPIKIEKVSVEFSKVDITTGKELPGATLEVRDSSGKLIERWVSTSTPHYIKLNPGKYTLKETIAPAGYELSTQTIEFEVKSNTVTKVVMKNIPIKEKDVYVEFSKVDVTTGKELPGATLEIHDSNGKLVERWVSTNQTHFVKLNPGKYTLKETIAPVGYELSTKVISFEVKENSTTTKIVMENKPIKVNVEFSKIDVTNNKELPGATLEVRDSNGKLIESWVSTNQTHFIELTPGVYTLTEIIAPEGYELSEEVISFEVKADGTTTKVIMKNDPIKDEKVDVEISKIDISTGKELPGATLEIRDVNGNLIEKWVSGKNPHYVKLNPGKYTLKETIAPEGYELKEEMIEFEVKDDGTVTKIVMENKPYVEVPITSLNASSATMIIGSLLIGLGLIVVYSYVKKYEA